MAAENCLAWREGSSFVYLKQTHKRRQPVNLKDLLVITTIDQFNINASVNQTLSKLSVWFVKCQKTIEKSKFWRIFLENKSPSIYVTYAFMLIFRTCQKHAKHHDEADASPVPFFNLKSSVSTTKTFAWGMRNTLFGR